MVMMPSTYQPSHSPKASPLSLVNITSSPPPMITPFNFVSTDTQACSCIIHTYHFSCIHTYIIHDAYVFVYTYIKLKKILIILQLYICTGSGFKSSDLYNNGFFSAKIKLPSDYTAGIVVAFYVRTKIQASSPFFLENST